MNRNIFMGKRVRLTAFAKQDSHQLAQFSEDAEYLRNLDTDFVMPRSRAYYTREIESYENNKNVLTFAIRLHDDTLLGFVSIHSIEWNNQTGVLAIGIGDKENRSKGYGSEAINLMLMYAFYEPNLNRVGLDVISNNGAAIQCYKNAGFVVEGVAREAVLRDGEKYDKIYMGILKDEWRYRR